MKNGAAGCLCKSGDNVFHIAAKKVNVIDTTAAGDSFNAGFLAARIAGYDAKTALQKAHQLAAFVITERGAIIDPVKLPDLGLN